MCLGWLGKKGQVCVHKKVDLKVKRVFIFNLIERSLADVNFPKCPYHFYSPMIEYAYKCGSRKMNWGGPFLLY